VLLEGFTPAERTVRLLRGEAHFAVVRDPARPFVVRAGQARIRALGTAFNVQLRGEAVDVIVTEGRIRVATPSRQAGLHPARESDRARESAPLHLELEAGEQVLLPAPEGTVSVVNRLAVVEIARALAWQEPLLNLGGATLAEVALQFERRTGHPLVIADPELAKVRVGGFFKPDDVEGFVHLLEACFGVQAERGAQGETRLRRKN
jgi:transmembrane sensor